MLEKLYMDVLSRYLTQDQVITLKMLVWLLQVHKTVKIERLAAHFSLPIKYESRRKRIQRLLKLDRLSVSLLWLRLFWFLCGNGVYTDSFFSKILLKVFPSKYFTIL